MSPKFQTTGEEIVETSSSTKFNLEVAKGNITGLLTVHKFGSNPSLAADTPEDVWSTGGLISFNTSNQSIEILGSSDDILTTGTGAWTVTVIGQSIAGTEQTETKSMNGVTPVALSNTYSHIYRAYVGLTGTAGTNVGDIVVRIAGAGATQLTINAGMGQSLMAMYRIPVGYTGFVERWECGIVGKTFAKVENLMLARKVGEAWRVKDLIGTSSSGSSFVSKNYVYPLAYPALTEIVIRAESDTNATGVSSTFDITLVAD